MRITPRLIVSTLLFALFAGAVARPVVGQTLADLAKKEEERRKSGQQQPAPAKVYTNKDLGAPIVGGTVATPEAAKDADPNAKDAKDAKDGKDAAKDAGAKDAGAKDAGATKDQAYWAGRMKTARDKLAADQSFEDALQIKINSLNTDFVNRDDPAQRAIIEQNRNKALAELNQLKIAIVNDKKALTDLEEEARKAGVPAGWLR